jgi:hypothetical protein
MAKIYGVGGHVLQPGTRVTTDQDKITVTERTYIGPGSISSGYHLGGRFNSALSEYIVSYEQESLEGGLVQTRITTKDLGEARDVRSVTEEWSRQYFSAVVPGYGYFMALGRWIMVPAAIVRCTRYTSGGYSRGCLGHGGIHAPTYTLSKPIRVKDTSQGAPSPGKTSEVTVVIAPSAWFCTSASCTDIGFIQEIEERWEVEYHVAYYVSDDYHI